MSVSLISIHQFPVSKFQQIRYGFSSNRSIRSWRRESMATRCRSQMDERAGGDKNYYKLLGVSIDSTSKQIKDAYRKLQKKYHPDIAGQEGHKHTLLLNKAYKILMREDLRREYDISIGQKQNASVLGYSSWKGPLRPQALFVDENACIGCRECVHHASNTFTMDEALGCARVKVQFGDDDGEIEVAVESCPVNCIYRVDSEELGVLEYLIQPQRKAGYGIYGQGWERPANVFIAAKAFTKQLKQQHESSSRMW